MIKICDNSLIRLLSLLLKKSFDNSYFPELWRKKTNVTPVHKKNITSKIFKIIAPFGCFLFSVKYLKKFIKFMYKPNTLNHTRNLPVFWRYITSRTIMIKFRTVFFKMDKPHHGDQFLLLANLKCPKSNVKLFADDAFLFSVVRNKNGGAKHLTHDLSLISKEAIKWKCFLTQTVLNLHKNQSSQ